MAMQVVEGLQNRCPAPLQHLQGKLLAAAHLELGLALQYYKRMQAAAQQLKAASLALDISLIVSGAWLRTCATNWRQYS